MLGSHGMGRGSHSFYGTKGRVKLGHVFQGLRCQAGQSLEDRWVLAMEEGGAHGRGHGKTEKHSEAELKVGC